MTRERKRRVLFVCEGNRHRSPTAEAMYATAPGLRAKSAGVSSLARTQLTDELLDWADIVFVMDEHVLRLARRQFGDRIGGVRVVCLDVPDDYQYFQPELIDLLGERLTPHLGPPTDGAG